MFYSYAYARPQGFRDWVVSPSGCPFDPDLDEFALPHATVRASSDPESTLMAFLESTHEAAARQLAWDRVALKAPQGIGR